MLTFVSNLKSYNEIVFSNSFFSNLKELILPDSAKCTHIVQDLTFQLRHNIMAMTGKKQMATICKLSRGHYMPPPFTSVSEWFHYAFATSEIKGKKNSGSILRY